MRAVKSKPLNIFPKYSEIVDEITKRVMKELSEVLVKSHRDIVDDFLAMQNVDRVDALPTAASEYRGRLLILNGVGTGPDTLFLGINTGSSGFGFKEISLV